MIGRCCNGRLGGGNDRRALLIDPRQRILDHRQPFGALTGARDQGGPPLHRLVAAAFLLGVEPEIILRHHVFGISGVGAPEQVFCLWGHHAVGSHRDGFAEIPQPRGVRTEYLQRVAPRRDRIVEASETEIDRRQQLPALARSWDWPPDISRPRRPSARSPPEAVARWLPRSSKPEPDSAIPPTNRWRRRRAATGRWRRRASHGGSRRAGPGAAITVAAFAVSAAAIRRRDTSTRAASASTLPIRLAVSSRLISSSWSR